MKNKITNVKDLEFLTNWELLANLIKKKNEQQPSKVLDDMSNALTEIFFYVNSLQLDRWAYDESISQYRLDKNRAVMRARASEEKLEELSKKLKNFNNLAK